LLESAIQELALDHDALRLRFARDASGWRQFLSEQVAIPFERVDLSSLTEAEQQSRLNALRDDKQFALNLESGPTMSATLFHLGLPKHDRLLLIIHHLAVDMVSWRIILEDLWNNYQNLQKSNSTRPRVRSSSFKQWSERLAGFAASEEARDECEFWLADKYARAMRLPSDHAHQANSVASTETVSVSLSPEETAVLWQDVPRVYNAQVKEALLSAVVQSLSEWTDCPQVLIDIEGHGREDIFDDLHLSNLVGWLACIYPVVLSLDDAPCPDEKLWRVKEQLRQVPRRGIGYGVLRHLSPHDQMAARLKNLPQAQVCLNYLGMIGQPDFGDAPFRLVREATGLFQDPERQRRYILEIDGLIAEDRLWVNWRYNKHLYRRETIVDLAESCQKALRELIESCRSPVSARYAPSDFPAAKLGHAELDLLMEEISQNEAD
jgi:non-ribosomal peptide synthase protein (TIGR01720 family)